jgi:hypothetical protein
MDESFVEISRSCNAHEWIGDFVERPVRNANSMDEGFVEISRSCNAHEGMRSRSCNAHEWTGGFDCIGEAQMRELEAYINLRIDTM